MIALVRIGFQIVDNKVATILPINGGFELKVDGIPGQ